MGFQRWGVGWLSPWNHDRAGKICVPRHLVGSHGALSPTEGLLGKLLDIGLASCIVHYGVIVGPLRLRGFQPFNQGFCEGEAVIVGGVKVLCHYLVDGVIFA